MLFNSWTLQHFMKILMLCLPISPATESAICWFPQEAMKLPRIVNYYHSDYIQESRVEVLANPGFPFPVSVKLFPV